MKKKTVKKTTRSKKAMPIESKLVKDLAAYQAGYARAVALTDDLEDQVYDLKEKTALNIKTINDLRNENGALLNIIEKFQNDLDLAAEANANLEQCIKEKQDGIEKAVEISNQNLEISKSAVKDMLIKDNDLQLSVFNFDSLHNEYLKLRIKYDTVNKENTELKNKKRFFGIF